MRWVLLLGLCGIVVTGCAGKKSKPASKATEFGRSAALGTVATNKPNVVVTPGSVVTGKISFVNAGSGFVVATFPIGTMPAAERRLNVYRNGLKVAEIKVGKEQMDVNAVADILTGVCQVGDEVRED